MEYIEGTKVEDLTGQKFNRLTVIKFAYFKFIKRKDRKNLARKAYFYCQCDCGNNKLIIVEGSSLKNGSVKSCGCLKKESGVKKRKHNKYDIDKKNNQVFFYLSNGEKFIIDLEDFDLVYEYNWKLDPNGYVISKEHITQKTIRLHSLLKPQYIEVDHKNQNKLDNRKNNLREVTRQENVRNRPISKNNTSGFTGVYWSKKDQSWYSQITVDGRNIHLGYAKSKKEAIISRLRAELKYFGPDFAPQRHLFEKYNII